MATSTADLAELAERIEREVHDAMRMPHLDAARAIANEAGLRRSRKGLADSLTLLAAQLDAVRATQERERNARDAYDTALLEAEWELDGRFEAKGNKTVLVRGADGPLPEAEQRSMTADERATWRKAEARKVPAVAKAAEALRKAEAETGAARDAVTLAEKGFSAAKADLAAAVAELQLLATGLTRNERE